MSDKASIAAVNGAVIPAGFPLEGLLAAGSIADFRALAPLPDEAQRVMDEAVVNVGLDRLTVVADLLADGLVYDLPNWLSVTELYHEKVSKSGGAQHQMNPEARGESGIQTRTGVRTPIYATVDDFNLGLRELLASARANAPLDTSNIEQCTRRVNEAIEDVAINGLVNTIGGNSVYGLLTAPNAATQTYTGTNKAWDHASKTGAEIITDVLAMVTKLHANKRYGPYDLYVPADYGVALNKNYGDGTTTQDYTIRERIERIVSGGRNIRVRVADLFPSATDKTVLVQKTRDVIDVVRGQAPTTISWASGSGMQRYFMVLACMVPRVKDDSDSKSGVCIGDVS